MAKQDKD